VGGDFGKKLSKLDKRVMHLENAQKNALDMADYLEGGKLDANAVLEMMIKMQKEILNQVASQNDLDDLRIQVDNNKKNIIDLEVQGQKFQEFSDRAEDRLGGLESGQEKHSVEIEELKRLILEN